MGSNGIEEKDKSQKKNKVLKAQPSKEQFDLKKSTPKVQKI